MISSNLKDTAQAIGYVKFYSYDCDNVKLIYRMFNKIVGKSDKMMLQTYRTRKLWSIKRSPHIFSKSQESFGYEVFVSYLTFSLTASKPYIRHSLWPVSSYDMVNAFMHIVPGNFWSFFSKLKLQQGLNG